MNVNEIPNPENTPLFKPVTPEELQPKPTDMPINREPSGVPIRKSHSYYAGMFDAKNRRFAYKDTFAPSKGIVKKSNISGYGVFAIEDIKAGDMIEECPAVLLDSTFSQNKDWVLNRYAFTWHANGEIDRVNGSTMALVLGNGMLYNHDDLPNAYFVQDAYLKVFRLYAISNIKTGDEITWYYGEGYANRLREERTMTSDHHIPEGYKEGSNKELVPEVKKGGCGCKGAKPKQTAQPKIQEPTASNQPSAEKLLFRSMIVPENILPDDKIQDSTI